jgi:hypothetical protein
VMLGRAQLGDSPAQVAAVGSLAVYAVRHA